LLQRAENVTFVYHSGTEGLFVGEKSRYLYQLQMETPLEIKETSVSMEVSTLSPVPIVVQKTEEVMEPLMPYLEQKRALSPSAIDKYLTCPLQFYFRYSAGLEEPDEVTEEVDARIFGNLFHDTMEALYIPFLGKELSADDIHGLMDDELKIQDLLLQSFRDNYFKGGDDSKAVVLRGRNWLVGEIVKKYVRQVLELDKKRAPFTIEGLENKFKADFPLSDGERTVLVGGKVDRIDKRDGVLEILDYKTGKADLSFTMLDDLFDPEKTNRNKAALQTLIYAAVVHANRKSEGIIQTGIYALRRIFEKDFQSTVTSKELGNQPINYVEHQEAFNEKLVRLLEEIFDTNVPFVQTEKEETCRYCAYKNICRRG
jgi:ATP-dependent helicase/DNAse subunit B